MTQTPRRKLLFVCPIMPQRSGNGLAMRAALMLEAFSRRFDVYLFVVPLSGEGEAPDFVRELTVKVGILSLQDAIDPLAVLIEGIVDPAERSLQRLAYPHPWPARFSGLAATQQVFAFLDDAAIDVLHVMRLYLAPLAEQLLRAIKPPAPVSLLDLDDDDARVHERLGELQRSRGDLEQAETEQAEARKYAASAARFLGRFSVVLMSSENDTRRLAASYPTARFKTLPNGYADVPPQALIARGDARNENITRLLFVANLSYLPNADAAVQLIHYIIPALRERGADVHLDIVGPGGGIALESLSATGASGQVAIHGQVESVSHWYAQADIVVVPLRAGGGTRIKILEAFAYGVPVVATHIGAEGLGAEDGKHLLLADDVGGFAAACERLAADAALAATLAANAKALLNRNYTPDRVHAKLDAIIDGLPREG